MTISTGYLRFPHVVADHIVFSADDDIWLAPAAGGRALRLTADGAIVSRPRLSPDGSLLAWVSRRGGGDPEVWAMPIDGGLPRQLTRFGHVSTTVLGFTPDGLLLVGSSGGQPFRSQTWAYTIDLASGGDPTPQRLPYGPVNAVAFHSSGRTIVGTGYTRDPAQWKRYRGGTAGRLWIASSPTGEFTELLAELEGPKVGPTWTGDRLAFIADFEGHGNVYSVDATGADLRRHTDHDVYYARQLTGDGTRLTYQHAGQLWLLDDLAADSEPRRLDLSLGSTRARRAPFEVTAAEHLGQFRVDETGRASAVEVRGSIVWLTHDAGPARAVASTPGVRYRNPVVLAGGAVGYVTGADGDDGIEVAQADGTTRRFAAGRLGRVLELEASPDGTTLAVATHDGRVLAVAVADGAITELETNPEGDAEGLAFSPDSRWLVWVAAEPTPGLGSIRLAELATGTVTAVTSRRFADADPAFSLDGKYLAFLSARTFDPVYDSHAFDLGFPLATRPYLVTLAADTPSPFDPELAGRPTADAKSAAPKGDAQGGAPGDADTTVRVDLDGIADRVVPFPVAAGQLRRLSSAKDGFLWLDRPVIGELGESRVEGADNRPSLQRWDFGKRKQVRLREHLDRFQVSGDGTKAAIVDGDSLTITPSASKAAEDGSDSVKVRLDRIRLTVDPPAEWAQMLDETGRLMRDHYWIADLAGIDWDAAVDKYRPLIDQVATRDDVSDVLWELNGETGSSHAYETPRESKPNPLLQAAYLGADLAVDSAGRWTITRIIPGDNSVRMARSPLTAPGVLAAAGDEIVAVNGRAVAGSSPAELLRGTADKPVELRLSTAGVQRSVVVTPLSAEIDLRYSDWVAGRRAAVHEASNGRIGYLHVPNMVSSGWAAFNRDLKVELGRDAVIVDTRDNSGGHISELVIEKLARRVIAWDTSRHHLSPSSYPGTAPRGPLVSLANEWSASDGDIVNAAIRTLELGPVIGVRTWGGVIGIDGRYSLVDGTGVTQPRYAFWFEKFGWGVENHGVDPDILVESPPHLRGIGQDPQLDAGIAYLLAELDRLPAPPKPDTAQRPSRRAPELPPRP